MAASVPTAKDGHRPDVCRGNCALWGLGNRGHLLDTVNGGAITVTVCLVTFETRKNALRDRDGDDLQWLRSPTSGVAQRLCCRAVRGTSGFELRHSLRVGM